MKKLLPLVLVIAAIAAAQLFSQQPTVSNGAPDRIGRSEPGVSARVSNEADALEQAYARQRSNVQVEGRGEVAKVLKDDNDGSRHQRFILALPSGRTLLIAHNIDLAARIENLREGDTVAFAGEYEWNNKGGVVHWTHRDPAGRHRDGWLEHAGRRYQ